MDKLKQNPSNITDETESAASVEGRTSKIKIKPKETSKKSYTRNLVGFWILGLCNNFAYIVMLSAAQDILKEGMYIFEIKRDTRILFREGQNNLTLLNFTDHNITTTVVAETTPPTNTSVTDLKCNKLSTGVVLLLDIVPGVIMKAFAPFFNLNYEFRVGLILFGTTFSFIFVGFATGSWMAFTGIMCASFASGLGEVTFLSYSALYEKKVVAMWSSGTGGAGIIGAGSYAMLTMFGLSPRATLLAMLIIPITMGVSFFIIILPPQALIISSEQTTRESQIESDEVYLTVSASQAQAPKGFKQKLHIMKIIFCPYIFPLSIEYFFQYLSNQGLYELLYYPDNILSLSRDEQYRWYQVDHQVGIFIARSSFNILYFKYTWILSCCQFSIFIILLSETLIRFMPSILICLFIIFIEGIVAGLCYTNTLFKVTKEVAFEMKQFAMEVVTMGDDISIMLSGIAALPLHDSICELRSI